MHAIAGVDGNLLYLGVCSFAMVLRSLCRMHAWNVFLESEVMNVYCIISFSMLCLKISREVCQESCAVGLPMSQEDALRGDVWKYWNGYVSKQDLQAAI